MRIAVSLDGQLQYTASLRGAGYLNAHLNLASRVTQGRPQLEGGPAGAPVL
jgi:hypothetical protein